MGVLPIKYVDFVKNPIVAMLFMSLIAIGYLYYDNKKVTDNQIKDLQSQVRDLQNENKGLNAKMVEILQKVK